MYYLNILYPLTVYTFLTGIVPKSPTGPPPPAYPASRNKAQSPQFAPPPQYPSDQGQQESGDTTDAVDKQFSKSILDEVD